MSEEKKRELNKMLAYKQLAEMLRHTAIADHWAKRIARFK